MKRLLFILLLLPIFANAQTNYLTGKNGQKVIAGSGINLTSTTISVSDGVAIPTKTIALGNVANLKAYAPTVNKQIAFLLGYRITNDGGGGTFMWDSLSTTTEDSGLVFQVTGISTGRWLRIRPTSDTNYYDIRWWGAQEINAYNPYLDPAKDIHYIIQNKIIARVHSCGKGTIYIPRGEYYCTQAITTRDQSIMFLGDGAGLASFENTRIHFPKRTKGFVFMDSIGCEGGGIKHMMVIAEEKALDTLHNPQGDDPITYWPYRASYDGETYNGVPHNKGDTFTVLKAAYDMARNEAGIPIDKNGDEIYWQAQSFQILKDSLNTWGITEHDSFKHRTYHGVEIHAPTWFEDVVVYGFSGNGFYMYGHANNNGLHQDASQSLFVRCHSGNNSGSGWYFEGPDANVCYLVNCDARDNGRHGYEDRSFLGNIYEACHANNNIMGHFASYDNNARTRYIACYGESGSQSNYFLGAVLGDGSLDGNGNYGGTIFVGSEIYGPITWRGRANPVTFNGSAITIGPDGIMMSGEAASPFRTRSIGETGVTHLTTDFAYADGHQMDLLSPRAYAAQPYTSPYPNRGMGPSQATVAFSNVMIGARAFDFTYTGMPGYLSTRGTQTYLKGDMIFNGVYNGKAPSHWICISDGVSGTYAQGLTGTGALFANADSASRHGINSSNFVYNGGFIRLSGLNTELVTGMIVNIGTVTNATIQAVYLDSALNKTIIATSQSSSGVSSASITYTAPVFRAQGDMFGPIADAPLLTTNDAGLRWYNTTASNNYQWNGEAWMLQP